MVWAEVRRGRSVARARESFMFAVAVSSLCD